MKEKNKEQKNIYQKFVRYGKLKVTKQRGYEENPMSFHTPPAKQGFYAMPYKFQELFLIGGIDESQNINIPGKVEEKWIIDTVENINREYEEDPEGIYSLKDYLEENDMYYKTYIQKNIDGVDEVWKEYKKPLWGRVRKEFYVDKDELIWSHLTNVPNNEVLARKGSWINTTVGTYVKYVKKYVFNRRSELLKYYNGNINSIPNNYSKDEFEVFFEDKQGS